MRKLFKFVGLALLLLLPFTAMSARYSVAEKLVDGDMTLLVNAERFQACSLSVESEIQRYNKNYLVVMTNVATGSANDTLFISRTPYIGAISTDLLPLTAVVTDTVSLAVDIVSIIELENANQASLYFIEVQTADEAAFTTDSLQVDIWLIRLERFRR